MNKHSLSLCLMSIVSLCLCFNASAMRQLGSTSNNATPIKFTSSPNLSPWYFERASREQQTISDDEMDSLYQNLADLTMSVVWNKLAKPNESFVIVRPLKNENINNKALIGNCNIIEDINGRTFIIGSKAVITVDGTMDFVYKQNTGFIDVVFLVENRAIIYELWNKITTQGGDEISFAHFLTSSRYSKE